MAGKKVQVTVPGGIRKVIQAGSIAAVGTTIEGLSGVTVTVDQLKTLLGIVPATAGGSTSGGGTSTAAIVVGEGLLGGGSVLGAVPIYLRQSHAPVIWDDSLLPDDMVVPAGGGSGGGGGGSSTLSGLSDVSITSPQNGQELTFNGTKWANQFAAGGVGAGGPVLVQKTYLRWQGPPSSAGSTSIALGNAPTVGNVMMLVLTGYDTSSPSFLTIPSGWTQIAYYNVNNTEGIRVAVRVVQSGDGASYTVGGGNGGNVFAIYEFANVLNISTLQTTVSGSGGLVGTATPEVQPNSYNIGVITTDAISAYASMTGATLLFDGTSAGTGTNNHPGVFYQPTVMNNVAITFTGANLLFPMGAVISVEGPPGGSGVPTGSAFASQGMKGASTTANTAANYQATILAESTLVAYWPFSDAQASTTVKDIKGTNNGTVSGNPVLFNAPGRIGATCAYLFSNQFFTGGPITVNRPVQDDFTLEAWILLSENITGASGGNWYQGQGIIGFDVSGTTNDWAMVLLNSNKLAGGTGNPDVTATGTQNLLDGAWHHVAMTRVKSTGVCTLYVDGVSQGTTTGGTQSMNAASTVQMGGFQGFIADVACYSSALSGASIAAHYAAGSPGTGAANSGTATANSGNITPDTHPTNPTIYDDEFEVGTSIDTAGTRFAGAQAWTGYTANTIASVVAQGALSNVTQGTSTSAGAGYAYPVPSGTWTFRWKGVRPAFEVFNLSTWKGYYFGTSGSGNSMLLQHETRNWSTGSYSFGGSDSSFSTNGNPAYFQLQWDGTNLIFSWSQTGYNSDFTVLATIAASSFIGTPDHIGFGTSADVNVDWIRRIA